MNYASSGSLTSRNRAAAFSRSCASLNRPQLYMKRAKSTSFARSSADGAGASFNLAMFLVSHENEMVA